MRLRVDDVAQAEAARHQQNADNRHRERQFVADHLRRAAQSAEQRILAVRRPARQRDAVNAQRGNGKQRQDADIEIDDPEINLVPKDRDRIRPKRNDRDRSERQRQRHQRRKIIRELVHARRRRIFLQQKLQLHRPAAAAIRAGRRDAGPIAIACAPQLCAQTT